jgi:hypothetical protein
MHVALVIFEDLSELFAVLLQFIEFDVQLTLITTSGFLEAMLVLRD